MGALFRPERAGAMLRMGFLSNPREPSPFFEKILGGSRGVKNRFGAQTTLEWKTFCRLPYF